jgi:serine/threonine-protein kinase RsbW
MPEESAEVPTSHPDGIEITVPLRVEFAATLRTVVAAIGSDAGFSVDELDDLRLALSEVFSVLAENTAAGGRARVSCSLAAGELSVTVAADPPGSPIALDDLATNILESVTDAVTIDADAVTFSKRSAELADLPRTS